MSITVAFMDDEAIRQAAEDVLNEHQVERAIPVEIEEIVEFGIGMEIRPIKALEARFGFEGALSHDLQTILIDEDHARRYPNRYRFTLAHELGHRILHASFITSIKFQNKQDWKSAVSAIDPRAYGRLEHQAYVFAGHILVPTAALLASCRDAQDLALQHGVDLSEMGQSAISYVAGSMAKEFKASTAVIERRIRNEDIRFAE